MNLNEGMTSRIYNNIPMSLSNTLDSSLYQLGKRYSAKDITLGFYFYFYFSFRLLVSLVECGRLTTEWRNRNQNI